MEEKIYNRREFLAKAGVVAGLFSSILPAIAEAHDSNKEFLDGVIGAHLVVQELKKRMKEGSSCSSLAFSKRKDGYDVEYNIQYWEAEALDPQIVVYANNGKSAYSIGDGGNLSKQTDFPLNENEPNRLFDLDGRVDKGTAISFQGSITFEHRLEGDEGILLLDYGITYPQKLNNYQVNSLRRELQKVYDDAIEAFIDKYC